MNSYSGDAIFDQFMGFNEHLGTDCNNNKSNGFQMKPLMRATTNPIAKFSNDDYSRELNTFTMSGSGMKGIKAND